MILIEINGIYKNVIFSGENLGLDNFDFLSKNF